MTLHRTSADGKRRRKYTYHTTQAEAVASLRKLGGRAEAGQLLVTSTPTVKTFLNDWFTTNASNWEPSTQRGYRQALDNHLVPAFGHLRLEKLDPTVVQRWLNQHKGKGGVRRRISLAHAVLKSALTDAQRLQLVTINVAMLVKFKKRRKKKIKPLSVEQAIAFMKVAGEHRLGTLFTVALASGLRLGEATGLKWNSVNLETGEVRIRRQLQKVKQTFILKKLKTVRSRRTLVLPRVCIEALNKHRTRQLETRLKAGADWAKGFDLVFTTYKRSNNDRKVGLPLDQSNVRRVLYALLEKCDPPIARIRFHDLRHSAASLLIANGVQLSEITLLLGHSELRVTSDLYLHLQRQTSSKAAQKMDGILGG